MTKKNPRKKLSPGLAAMPAHPIKLWFDQSQSQEVRIEIIPLIDVIFCILTFFILAAVNFSRQQAINLDLPKAQTGAPQMRDILIVTLDDFGQVYVEQQPIVTRNQLYQRIQEYHQARQNGVMVLNASKNASYNDVVQVLDVLREVGGDRVALATLPGESAQSDNSTTFPGTSFSPSSLPNSTEQFNLNPSSSSGSGVPPAPEEN
jgi:biopolymer transport protein ExbD